MSYYHGLISSRTATVVLGKAVNDGCFLIRDSQSQPGNFVLSVRYGGNVYHILIFHEAGEYFLDSSSENEGRVDRFTSLEDLVLFGMSHELRVADEEVILHEPILCDDGSTAQLLAPMNGQRRRRESSEDCDILTDLFASVFGSHCSVLVVIHSQLQFDGSTLPPGHCYLGCVVKDNLQKAFFIRVIDPSTREMVGEKKLTKHFEYDMPSDIVMTFLSEHGITCLGFRDLEERNIFVRHVDRIVQMQQERKVKVRKHSSSSPPAPDGISPTHSVKQLLKAEEFDIHNLTPEWQYLFEQAGLTLDLLNDKSILQFVLTKIYEMGGAPKQLQNFKQCKSNQEERAAAIAVDSALRHESVRASRLADELRKHSSSKDIPRALPRKFHPPTCTYSGVSTRYKELLMRRSSLSALSPLQIHCYCSHCAAGKPLVSVSGTPPHQYTLPVGWCQFLLRSQTHSLSQRFCSNWHVAFSTVPAGHVASVIRTGRLMHSVSDGSTHLSPDIKWAKRTASITPEMYHDEVERRDFKVSTAFQVFVQPGSYSIEKNDVLSEPLQQTWKAPERTYISYALLIQLHPLSK